jgi:hypothetical protein
MRQYFLSMGRRYSYNTASHRVSRITHVHLPSLSFGMIIPSKNHRRLYFQTIHTYLSIYPPPWSLNTHTSDNHPLRLVCQDFLTWHQSCRYLRFYFGFPSSPRVCPLVHPLYSSVSQSATTTQDHSVCTGIGSPSSRATRLLSNVLPEFLTWCCDTIK